MLPPHTASVNRLMRDPEWAELTHLPPYGVEHGASSRQQLGEGLGVGPVGVDSSSEPLFSWDRVPVMLGGMMAEAPVSDLGGRASAPAPGAAEQRSVMARRRARPRRWHARSLLSRAPRSGGRASGPPQR